MFAKAKYAPDCALFWTIVRIFWKTEKQKHMFCQKVNLNKYSFFCFFCCKLGQSPAKNVCEFCLVYPVIPDFASFTDAQGGKKLSICT